MMRILFVTTLLLLAHLSYAQLIPLGSTWRYYDLGNEPPNQSSHAWEDLYYDDATWDTGPAELGYGDNDEATVIASSTLTGYFRHIFIAQDPGDFQSLNLTLTYDDGAVIYLNGNEVWRVNMPGGNINYNTFASSTSGENAQASTTINNTLQTGENVLAVEVHQRSASSSDISFNFSMTGVPLPGVAIILRGPYLQKANDTSMVVRWRTNIPTASMVDYGASPVSLIHTAFDNALKTEHILFIDSLAPQTKYFYQVKTTTDTLLFPDSSIYFKTYPTPGEETPLTAWILGDCGTGNNNARNVRNAYYNYIGDQHTDMVLFLGDNAYNDGTDTEYQTALFQNMYEQKLRNSVTWSCLGNHDGNSANSNTQTGPYYNIFTFPKEGECGGVASGTEAYYSYDFGNIHFLVLDSHESDRSVGGAMYDWCEEDLMNTMAKWIIAYWHHPAYSKGSHSSDVDVQLKQMRENFLPLFESHGVDLVLSGHSHSYERTFLLNGHYGLSSTFNTAAHTVGVTGSGSGHQEDDGAYYKAPTGPESGSGAVYITTGSAGKTEAGPINHPAMFYDAISLGSCVLTVHEDTLNISYLRQTGAVDDHFTLIKDGDCVPGASCSDGDSCTVNDVFDNYCYCRGESNRRYVSNSEDIGEGSLRDAINFACEGDTIFFLQSVSDTIHLDSQITISQDIVINASVSNPIILSGQNSTRLFYIEASVQLSLINLTLFGGNEPVDGGAILNDGILALANTSFIQNMQGPNPKAWTNRSEVLVKQGNTYIRLD